MAVVISSGTSTIKNGTLLTNPIIKGSGTLVISSGGIASGAFISSGGRENVLSSGVDYNATVSSGGMLAAMVSGYLYNPTVLSSGYVSAMGGKISSGTIGNGGTMAVTGWSSGGSLAYGYVSAANIVSGGVMTMEYYATGSAINVQRGSAYIYHGGYLQECIIGSGTGSSKGAEVSFKNGASGHLNHVYSNGIMIVSGNGSATSTKVHSGGWLVVSSAGKVNVTSVLGGTADILPSGSATSTTIESNGRFYVSGSAECSNTTISSGSMYLMSGGRAYETKMFAGGSFTNYADSFSGTFNGGKVFLEGGSSFSEKMLGGEMHVSANGTSRGYAQNLTISSATVYLYSDTNLNVGFAYGGAKLYVYEGARASSVNVYNGGDVFVKSGGYLSGGTIYGGSETIMSGGSAYNMTVQLQGTLDVRGRVYSCTVGSGGKVILSSGGRFVADLMASGAIISAMSGGTAAVSQTSGASAVVSGGSVYVYGGSMAYGGINGGQLHISSGGKLQDAFITAGTLAIQSGGSGVSALVIANSELANLTVNPSGFLGTANVSGGSARLNIGSGALVNTANVLLGARATIEGTINTSCLVYSGASAVISSGGSANYVTVTKDSFLTIRNAGRASIVTVTSGGDLVVNSGGTAVETTVGSSGVMTISSGGSVVSGVTVTSGGWLRIASSGYADAIILNNNGEMQIEGGTVMNLLVRKDCRAIISGGSIVSATLANGGSALCYKGRMAGTVSSGGTAVFSGGMTTGLTVIGGGKVRLADTLSMLEGDSIAFGTGGILDFDISGITASSYAALLEGYNDHILYGSDAVYTLTVDGSQKDMTYLLASNASLFNSTITVQNSSGESLGTLTLNAATKIGDKYYTLSVIPDNNSVNNLLVSVASAAPGPEPVTVPPFLTGDFNGDKADMLARQKDGTVTIFMNGEPWGLGVTLDKGWDAVATGDFNGDKMDDILRLNDEGYVVGEMSNGNGTFTPQVLNLKNAGWSILGTGDFNHNGTDDVLIANPTGASETVGLLGYWESGVTWTLINGYSAEWEMVATGDFNADGKCDMLWRNSFEGEGGLTYNAYCTWIVEPPAGQSDWRMVSVANPTEWNFLCSGDFNGDKMNDIAMINGEGVVGIWGVNDGYLSSWSILSAVDTSAWELAGVGDFNGDGSDDIAWRQTSTGLTGYWQINNKELTGWQNIATIA